MERIEELKQELLKQKKAIEDRKGKVNVANINPSPSEITAGIETIIASDIDFGSVTALPEDVKQGKKFVDATGKVIDGTFKDDLYLFLYNPVRTVADPQEFDYIFPDEITIVKEGLFCNTPHKLNVWLNLETTEIRDRAFDCSGRVTLKNFAECSKLKTIYERACKDVKGVDMMNLPESITAINSFGFHNVLKNGENTGLTVPPKLTQIYDNIFGADTSVLLDTLVFSYDSPVRFLSEQMFYNVGFNCDFAVPKAVRALRYQTFYNSHFKNLELPEGLTTLEDYALYGSTRYIAETITFNSVTPPNFGTNTLNKSHAGKIPIYVPDSSVQEYQAAITGYEIKPISEKVV